MDTLRLQNAWWLENKVKPELIKDFRRDPYSELVSLMDTRQVLVMSGLRRVGKSTLMMQLIQWLISEKQVDTLEILYFSFDEQVENHQAVLKTYGELTARQYDEPRGGRLFIFLDEIQKLKNWAGQVKLFYDMLPKPTLYLFPLIALKWGSSVITRNDLVVIAVAAIIESAVGRVECRHLSRAASFATSTSSPTISKADRVMMLSLVSAVSFPRVFGVSREVLDEETSIDRTLGQYLSFSRMRSSLLTAPL